MKTIEINHLTKYYGKARGIIDVSFDVEEGEIFGFIGPNGAGKSTTIRTLLGLIYPTSGNASIFGKDCIAYGPEIRREIGYLPGEVFYYDKMKVIDLLRYSASFYGKNCNERIEELAAAMDLDLTRKIDDLSLGNKKKVGIVQGLLHSPKLIILDEPTSGLDPLMQQKFFDLLFEENKRGATVLLSSHILGEVQRLCKRVAIIKEGRIIRIENMSDLKNNSHKSFVLETAGEPAKASFELPGVTGLEITGHEVRFLYNGNLNDIVKAISGLELHNLSVSDPDLEEIFLHYYSKEA